VSGVSLARWRGQTRLHQGFFEAAFGLVPIIGIRVCRTRSYSPGWNPGIWRTIGSRLCRSGSTGPGELMTVSQWHASRVCAVNEPYRLEDFIPVNTQAFCLGYKNESCRLGIQFGKKLLPSVRHTKGAISNHGLRAQCAASWRLCECSPLLAIRLHSAGSRRTRE
jgi:hypothetical protein